MIIKFFICTILNNYSAGFMAKGTLPKVLVDQVEVTCVLEEQLHDYV